MVACNKPIKCWDLLVRPCKRPAGHTPGLCNPFSLDHPFDLAQKEEPKEDSNSIASPSSSYQRTRMVG